MLFTQLLPAQQKKAVTLEDVFKKGSFNQRSVYGINWMKDGQFYSSQVTDPVSRRPQVVKINIATGETVETLIDGAKIGLSFRGYTFNADESKALLTAETESIYRRSSKSVYYVYDLKTQSLKQLMDGEKISYATFSPDNSKLAFTKDNDLYYIDLNTDKVTQVTTDGEWNNIINGSADWVYEEEFSMAQAFAWSPDGQKLAFMRFDESEVKEYNMQLWGELYPEDYKFKYPKAGEKNADIEIRVHHLNDGKTVTLDAGAEKDIYLPRMYWTGDSNTLSFIRLNRFQNQLDILHADVRTGQSKVILSEKSKTYVDLNYNDELVYLSDNKTFIRTSEQDGFKHIYHHNMDGSLIRQITKGDWEVNNIVSIDEQKKQIYFISTEGSPLERNLYVIDFAGKKKTVLTPAKGTHRANMSPDHKFFIDYYSTANTPQVITLYDAKGKVRKVLEDNQALVENLKGFALSQKEFFDFKTVDGTSLNGYLIKPADFDPNKKYPVLMYVYGGPGSQNVTNAWGGTRDFWHHHLASLGYIVACVDNRGTGARGRDFKHVTYGTLGKYEVEDQIAGAKFLAGQSYVDAARIGIWGWSYGGYMSSLSLFIGNDVFKSAIAVAPVTSWRYYDSIYTERYLMTPQANASGYDAYNPITHAAKMKGNLLLIHGTGDDNVHFQNAVELVDALIDADKQFESFYYPNRNHGISGGNTSWHLYQMMTDFIKRKL